MSKDSQNYSNDRDESEENDNRNGKYDISGESEYSRESTIPYDQDEVLSVRHYNFGPQFHGKERVRVREKAPAKTNYRGRGPRGYRKSDEAIQEDVSEALYRSSEVDASEIEVFVQDGFVTLKGSVSTRNQKKMAESAVEYIAGVEDVYNELHIRDGSSKQFAGRVSPKGLVQNTSGLN